MFGFVFGLPLSDCLPLHVRGRISTSALKRPYVVYDIASTGTCASPGRRAGTLMLERISRRPAALDLAVTVAHHSRIKRIALCQMVLAVVDGTDGRRSRWPTVVRAHILAVFPSVTGNMFRPA